MGEAAFLSNLDSRVGKQADAAPRAHLLFAEKDPPYPTLGSGLCGHYGF